jgi:hypothetical protein
MLPPVDGTVAEYANQLRALAARLLNPKGPDMATQNDKIRVTLSTDDLRELLWELQLRGMPGPTTGDEAARAIAALQEAFDKRR